LKQRKERTGLRRVNKTEKEGEESAKEQMEAGLRREEETSNI
jgi:hypothetical protein